MRALAVAVMVVLFACSGAGSTSSGGQAVERPTPDSPAAPDVADPDPPSARSVAMGDMVALQNGDTVQVFTYTAPVRSGDPLITPAPGMQFAAIEVEGCSMEESAFGSVHPGSFELAMGAGNRLQSAFPVKEPQLSSGPRAAGDCIRGWVTFEVPAGDTPAAVVFNDSGTSVEWNVA